MTENYSLLLEVGAKQLGKKAAKLTQAERAQAKYLGVLQVSTPFVGDSAKLTDQFSGKQAMLNAKWVEAKQELGSAYIPVLEKLMSENKQLAAGLTAGIATILALITVLSALVTVIVTVKWAMIQLQIAMGPVGWAIASITLALTGLTAGLGAYALAADEAAKSVFKFAKNQEELNEKLSDSPLKNQADDVKELQADIEKINETLEERKRLLAEIEEIKKQPKKVSFGLVGGTGELAHTAKLNQELKELDKTLSQIGINTPDDAPKVLEKLNKEIEESIPALLELKHEELGAAAATSRHIDEMESLIDQYEELIGKEDLSLQQKQALRQVVQKLKEQYPSLLEDLDEEGKYHIINKDAVEELITSEKNLFDTKTTGMKLELQEMRKTTEEKLKLIRKQIEANQLLIQSDPFTAGIKGLELATGAQKAWAEERKRALQNQKNATMAALNEIDQSIVSIETGDYLKLPDAPDTNDTVQKTTSTSTSASGKSTSELADDLRAKNFQSALSTAKYVAEMYNQTEEQQIEALEKLKANHAEYLSKNVDDERMIDLEIKRLKGEMDEDEFQNSIEWIERETYFKRLSLAEQLAAWQRVQDRYLEGTEEREQAECELFRIEQELGDKRVQEAEKMQDEILHIKKEALEKERELEREALIEANEEKVRALQEEIEELDEDYDQEIDGIRDKIDAIHDEINAFEELEKARKRQLEQDELVAKREAILQDQRFSKVVKDENGDLTEINTYDEVALAEIDSKLEEWDREEERHEYESELQERKRQLEDEIDALNHKKDVEIDALHEELEELKEVNEEKVKAFNLYWRTVLDGEQMSQDVRNEIIQTGLETAMESAKTFLDDILFEYERSINEMIEMGRDLSSDFHVSTDFPRTQTTTNNNNSTNIGTMNVQSNDMNSFLSSVDTFKRIGRG